MDAYIEKSKNFIRELKRWGDFLYNLDIDDKNPLVKEYKFWENLVVTKPANADNNYEDHPNLFVLTERMYKFIKHVSEVLHNMVLSDRIEENDRYFGIKEMYINIVLHIEKINEFINDITRVIEFMSNLNIDDKNTLVKEYNYWCKVCNEYFVIRSPDYQQLHVIQNDYQSDISRLLYNLIYSDKDYDDVHYKFTKMFIK